jgi:hypothetical protein
VLLPTMLALAGAVLPLAAPAAADAPQAKVAIIVGPVGPKLTPSFLRFAEAAAAAAVRAGAKVERAYSPNATPERVEEITKGANIVIYFGHGTGYPNPYSKTKHPALVDGWGLQGPNAHGTHAAEVGDGTLKYYGEDWLKAHIHPAPGFVMIYSNTCYAAGSSEARLPKATEAEALAHVSNYSAPVFAMGGSAYFATDFDAGAARLVAGLLTKPASPFGKIFKTDPRYQATGLETFKHSEVKGAQVWLHHSAYIGSNADYWYAFAGDPRATFSTTGAVQPADGSSDAPAIELGTARKGAASSYPFTKGFETKATVALPVGLVPYPVPAGMSVVVCADTCQRLPVVDSCTCFWGTDRERIVNLSHAAWRLISKMPLAEGVIPVTLYLDGDTPLQSAVSPPKHATDASRVSRLPDAPLVDAPDATSLSAAGLIP